MSVYARCNMGGTRTLHSSMTEDLHGVPFPEREQLFFDPLSLEPVGTEIVCLEHRLKFATGRARRALVLRSPESDGTSTATPMDEE